MTGGDGRFAFYVKSNKLSESNLIVLLSLIIMPQLQCNVKKLM